MLFPLGVAIGAGIAAALLFSVTIKGTALAMALAYLSPLPIMIAALGWGLQADLIAVVISGSVVAGVLDPVSGLIYAVTVALPSGLLAGLAVLDRANPFDPASPPARPFRAGAGALAAVAAGLGFAVSAGAIGVMIILNGGYDKAIVAFRQLLQPTLDDAMGSPVGLPEGLSVEDVGQLIIKFAPAAIAASTALMLLINLYVAGRTTQLSDRLSRGWLDLPSTFKLPAWLGLLTLAADVAWYLSPEPFNPFAAALGAPLSLIFLAQGLAALHALSRRAPGRWAVMVALYLAVFLAPRWVGPALVAFGLAESALKLRMRNAARPPKLPHPDPKA